MILALYNEIHCSAAAKSESHDLSFFVAAETRGAAPPIPEGESKEADNGYGQQPPAKGRPCVPSSEGICNAERDGARGTDTGGRRETGMAPGANTASHRRSAPVLSGDGVQVRDAPLQSESARSRASAAWGRPNAPQALHRREWNFPHRREV